MHIVWFYDVLIDSKDKDEDGDEDEEEVLMVEEDIGYGATTENIFDKIYNIFGINWVLFFSKHPLCMWILRACAKLLDKKISCPYFEVVLEIQRTWRELTNFWRQTRRVCLRSDNVRHMEKGAIFRGKKTDVICERFLFSKF